MINDTSIVYSFLKSQLDLIIYNIINNKYNEEVTFYDTLWLQKDLENEETNSLWQDFQVNMAYINFVTLNVGLPNPNASMELVVVKINTNNNKQGAIAYFEIGKRKDYLLTKYRHLQHAKHDDLFENWEKANKNYHLTFE
ncbi:hypothetical protein GCM10025879_02380 [Leuconostoc litchii]|uniref:Uncharacterized protein n=1 Tax=Leuconostoc litchii TaxID=1981069 RepID=A0A6P2CS38_9LACO|nr:hypothetical protein [Leuconostoc litchii]TYC47059.1 hypothetical protein ESZ47_02700 [Leuconostoc litchii]GMA68992.1 hypothetical protein GCM10025879_02380 [Leuconostoc litchii]